MTRSPARDNSAALRLAAALAVVIGHGYVLTGQDAAPRLFGVPLHTLGVMIFFAISGYLVAGSRERNSSALSFLWHRCLRIFPALIVVVLATVFVVGPLVSSVGSTAYFADPATWSYLRAAALVPGYDLPGVFTDPAHARTAVNGSLWTLGVEFLCYLVVLLVGFASRTGQLVLFLLLASGAVVISAAAAMGFPPVESVAPAAQMIVFFAAGALVNRSRVPLRASVAVPLFAAWIAASLLAPQAGTVIAWFALPYCVLVLAFASTPGLRAVGRMGDLSYGTYLWAYLVHQVVIGVLPSAPLPVSLAITIGVTGVLAALSWWGIERPALRLKNRPAFRPWYPATVRVAARSAALT